QTDPLALFDTLGLREQLSTSRASGLSALAAGVLALAHQHA
ncbi:cysteine desulfurase sulfur acceptor subunit CsdE, partial [Salmonella enterica]|nr:cysteine desulfurase sulfur acceptor subunit CsdE [Salmonella enterica]